MSVKKSAKNRLKSAIFGVLFAIFGIFGTFSLTTFLSPVNSAYAEPGTETSTSTGTSASTESATPVNTSTATSDTITSDASDDTSENTADIETCQSQVGALAWFICPGTGVLSKAIDSIYAQIEKLLVVDPVSTDGTSPIFQIWQIMRDITNIVFVIVFLIVIYSQITGIGITNYGIKKALPKLIIAAILVNMSYIICALAVDVSNIIGAGIQGIFENVQIQAINSGGLGDAATVTWTDITTALIGGGAIAGVAIIAGGGLWPLLGTLIIGVISVLIGLLTLGLRQALISILIMIAPLATVCYLLPNTEKWFTKWKDIFISMLVFYPLFSLLYGASQLAGWALVASSVANGSAFGIIVGMAVQVIPLILSISLMKMSGTVLGKVSSGLDNLMNKPRDSIRQFTAQRGELSKLRRINNSGMPSAHLQRYLDKRQRKLELDTENETKIRKGRAEIWAQRAILGTQKYDPAFIDEYKNKTSSKKLDRSSRIRTTASTRAAKQAMNIDLAAQTAVKDTAHVLGNYGDYHYSSATDKRLSTAGANNYLDFYRASRAEENDTYADQDWLINQYDKARKAGEDSYDYKHYIVGGAGALGKAGENMVLGQVVHASAKNEAARRSYQNLVFSKWGYTKSNARDFIVGYAVDDDGFAVDRITREKLSSYTDPTTGNVIKINERSPGEFLKYHPEYLKQCAYNLKDEHGYYYNATDQEGNFIGRVYKNDGAAIKEILANWDMPINDPINGLYGILSGIKPGEKAIDYPFLDGVGLASYSTTLQRATLSAGFKEKAAFAGPMYATSVGQRYIKDLVHLNIARLDNLIKTAKPSGFNTQDAAEFGQLMQLMDPENWDWMLFDEESLKSFKNVNGRRMKGTRYRTDENGNYLRNAKGKLLYDEIDPENATAEDLKNTVIRKYLAPAAPKFATMMSRMTPNVMDNQKPGVADNWNGLLDSMEKWNSPEYKEKYAGLNDPFAEQQNDTITRAREVGRQIRPKRDNSGELVSASPELQVRKQDSEDRANQKFVPNAEDRKVDREFEAYEREQDWSGYASMSPEYKNHGLNIDMIAARTGDDTNAFIHEVKAYLDDASVDDDRINDVIDGFRDFEQNNRFDLTIPTEDYVDTLKDLLATYLYEE